MGTGQETSEVRAGHELDERKLGEYLEGKVEGFARGPIKVRQFKVGQSNPTFMVVDSKGTKFVVRKKPKGTLIATAHMIEREYQILSALKKVDFPVPKVFVFCDDSSIIGTPFYVMEFLDGRIFTDVTLADLSPSDRAACYKDAVKTLALLHSIDYKKIGLENFGKPSGFYQRQISRMCTTSKAQEIAGKVGELPHLKELERWYQKHQVGERSSVVHGDYKLDNLVFHPSRPCVIGVLDWEMATIGHPLSDLANLSLPFYFPDHFPPPIQGLGTLPRDHGIPTEEEFVSSYCELSGREYPIPGWVFCVSFSFFRMAVILQGIASRAAKGQASNPMAEVIGQLAGPLAERAWEISQGNKSKL